MSVVGISRDSFSAFLLGDEEDFKEDILEIKMDKFKLNDVFEEKSLVVFRIRLEKQLAVRLDFFN